MKIISFTLILSLFLPIWTCKNQTAARDSKPGYRLSAPDSRSVLPGILHEISGITVIDPVTIACIQDEDGTVFIYDLLKDKITRQIPFYSKGDFEGIAVVDDTIFVLRSDGFLFEIKKFRSAVPNVGIYPSGIAGSDYEGLCYDAGGNRLLITCKEFNGKGSGSKNSRPIFAFDIRSKTFSSAPAITFDIREIAAFAAKNKISLPVKVTKKKGRIEPDLQFHPSGASINPLNGKLYILSSEDHLLLVSDLEGKVEDIIQLSQSLYNQPEGIAFMKNGDMLISNEGGDLKPTLLRIRYRNSDSSHQ